MITKKELIGEVGSGSELARLAGVSKQAVSQWPDAIPVASAARLARTGRWSLQDLRPDIFGPPPSQPEPDTISDDLDAA
jgi:DNA-binding transcriptional regulator YdaS (Cro superfamily)